MTRQNFTSKNSCRKATKRGSHAAHKSSTTSYSPATYSEARRLVELFRSRGVPDDITIKAMDMMLDMGELSVSAMISVLDQVTCFLKGKIPEPSENFIINLTVVTIMELIIESREDDDSDNYRAHTNHYNDGGKRNG